VQPARKAPTCFGLVTTVVNRKKNTKEVLLVELVNMTKAFTLSPLVLKKVAHSTLAQCVGAHVWKTSFLVLLTSMVNYVIKVAADVRTDLTCYMSVLYVIGR
jgi:hypothetical protein